MHVGDGASANTSKNDRLGVEVLCVGDFRAIRTELILISSCIPVGNPDANTVDDFVALHSVWVDIDDVVNLLEWMISGVLWRLKCRFNKEEGGIIS